MAGRQAGEKWVHPRPTFRDFQKVVGHVTHCKHTAHTACDQRRISCLRNGMQRTESAQHTAFLVSAGLAGCQECNAHVQYSFLSHCSLLVGCLTSKQHASVSQGRICTDNFTLRQKLQIKFSISPSHSILTPGQPVPALTL